MRFSRAQKAIMALMVVFTFAALYVIKKKNTKREIASVQTLNTPGFKAPAFPTQPLEPIAPKPATIAGGKSLSKLSKKQPTKEQITNITKVPAIDAAEVEFDISELKKAAKEKRSVNLQLTATHSVNVNFSTFNFENKHHNLFGFLEGKDKQLGNEVFLTTDGKDILVGLIQAPPRAYQIIYSGHKTSYVIAVDQSKIANIEGHPDDPARVTRELKLNSPPPAPPKKDGDKTSFNFKSKLTPLLASYLTMIPQAYAGTLVVGGSRTFVVWVVMTSTFVSAYGGEGGAQAMAANQFNIANSIYANYGTGLSFAIAGFQTRSDFVDSGIGSTNLNGHLTKLYNERNTIDGMAFLRNSGIDLTHLLTAYQGSDGCGIAYYADTSMAMAGVGVSAGMCLFKYTVAHELGHNLGMNHERMQATLGDTYNWGWTNFAAKNRTIMSYGRECGDDYYDPKNVFYGGTSTCPAVAALSSGQTDARFGGIANDARWALEASSKIFFGPQAFFRGRDAITNSYLDDFFSREITDVPVIEGAGISQHLFELRSYNFIDINPTSTLPTSYLAVLKNGAVITSQPLTTTNYTRWYGAGIDSDSKLGDVYEIRIGNRFYYEATKLRVTEVRKPITIPPITRSVAAAAIPSGTSVDFSIAPTGNPSQCNWLFNGQKGNSITRVHTTTKTKEVIYTYVNCSRPRTYNGGRGNGDDVTISTSYTVYLAPAFTTQPQSQNIGSATSLNLTAAATGADLTYQWYKNGVALSGQTTTSLSLTGTGLGGTYKLRASTPVSFTDSADAVIVDTSAPIVTLAAAQDVNENATLTLAAQVSGTPSPTVQWLYNNAVVGTSATLSIPAIKRAQAGAYTLRATNSIGTTNMVSTVRVLFKPEIKTQPATLTTVKKGQPLNLAVTAEAIPAPTYKWIHKNAAGTEVTLATTTPTLTIPQADWVNRGSYICEVTNQVGSTRSIASVVNVPSNKNEAVIGNETDQLLSPRGANLMGPVELNITGGFYEQHP